MPFRVKIRVRVRARVRVRVRVKVRGAVKPLADSQPCLELTESTMTQVRACTS